MKKSKRQLRAEVSSRARRSGQSDRAASSPSSARDFNPDYSYVIKDLRRIGILAGSFIVILVALSFIIS